MFKGRFSEFEVIILTRLHGSFLMVVRIGGLVGKMTQWTVS
jgi:hypothetical protein